MKKAVVLLAIVFTLLLVLSSKEKEQPESTFVPGPVTAQTRSFYMGFSTWPPDMEVSAIQKSYELTNEASDLRLIHMDGGVPWVEMSTGQNIPERTQGSWNYTKNQSKGKKIFVAITPLNFERTGLALWSNTKDDNQPLPEDWANLKLNDDKVKKAYLAYAKKVADFWHPDFLAIGIEANIAVDKNIEKWNEYLDLHQYVYKELKKSYPSMPVFATVQAEHFSGLTDDSLGNEALQKTELAKLMPYEDVLALSVYPYTTKQGKFASGYFDSLLAFKKPLAISETGWPSHDFTVNKWYVVRGSLDGQAEYMEALFKKANELKFKFVVNWVNVDYNKLLEKLPKESQEIAQAWVYDGLWNKDFQAKPALTVWKNYMSLSHK